MKTWLFALAIMLTATSTVAQQRIPPASAGKLPAQDIISASDPKAILDIAKGFGRASLEKDKDGDPKIVGRINGKLYQILFFGCTDNEDCDNIQFQAGWSNTKITLPQINRWNRGKRFGKAYLDADNDPVIEMDVNTDYGITRKNLEDTFDYWVKVLSSFKSDALGQ